MSDIVDRITELVDDQLAAGELRARYPTCWHCGRPEHHLALTEKVAGMYARGVFDEDYRVDTDDSRVLCRGSDFIGPMPAERPAWRLPDDPFDPSDWLDLLEAWRPYLFPAMPGAPWLIPASQERWWRTEITVGGGTDIEQRPLDNTTTLNVGDTSATWPAENVHIDGIRDEVHVWQETTPAREFSSRVILDVLAETAPDIGGTWEPLTAPGVRRHPDTGPLRRTGDRPWDYTFDPQEGDRIAVQIPGFGIRTGVVSDINRDRPDITEFTVTTEPDAALGWLALQADERNTP